MSDEPHEDRGGKRGEAEEKPEGEKKPGRKTRGERPWYRRARIVGPLIVVVVILAVVLALWWRHSRTREKTDDAYVDVVSEQVSSQVAGRVIRVLVNDNQDVSAGQELVQIDPADYQSRLEQAQAAQAQAEAQLAEAKAQFTSDSAQVDVARANLGTAEANSTNASRQLDRYRHLREVNPGAVSAQQMDAAIASDASASAQLDAAQKSVTAAASQLGYALSLQQAARAGIQSAISQVGEAQLEVARTHVKAKISGRVATKTVSPGNYVTAGAPLMAIVPREVYVTADFKETQLNLMRRGQPVRIRIDAYPDLKLTGRVDSIEPATGQTFSLIPAENATGNWVKIVQRVAVKIVFDQRPDDPDKRLAPGMSAEVWVTVR